MMNQNNNKKCIKGFIDRDAIPDWMLNYKSVGWALLMGAWFMDFLAALFKRMLDRSKTLPTVAGEAYTEALAPHHNWLIRSAAWVGLNACASREEFVASVCKEQSKVLERPYTPEEMYSDAKILGESAEEIGKHIWALFAKYDITKIED